MCVADMVNTTNRYVLNQSLKRIYRLASFFILSRGLVCTVLEVVGTTTLDSFFPFALLATPGAICSVVLGLDKPGGGCTTVTDDAVDDVDTDACIGKTTVIGRSSCSGMPFSASLRFEAEAMCRKGECGERKGEQVK